ncbi:hypothetical protein BKA63DRAFT_183588 [Paraphoma chrysanthemicola]|nr:hypothetical protein BKA63DRAFT_183588 [Paraphoma chrysanthemicola]
MPTVAEEALAQLTEAATLFAKCVEEKNGLQGKCFFEQLQRTNKITADLEAAQQKIARLEQIIRGKSEKETDVEEMTHQAGESGLMGLLRKQRAATKVMEMQNTEMERLGGLEIVREQLSETAALKTQMAELNKAERSIERKLAAGEINPSRETPSTERTASLQLLSQEPTAPISRASRKRSVDGSVTMPPPELQPPPSRASIRQSA